MVGFQGKAKCNGEDDLPEINFDEKEMQDVKWFHRDYIRDRLEGGSTALMYNPTEEEKEFHIPGKASLARLLITEWVMNEN